MAKQIGGGIRHDRSRGSQQYLSVLKQSNDTGRDMYMSGTPSRGLWDYRSRSYSRDIGDGEASSAMHNQLSCRVKRFSVGKTREAVLGRGEVAEGTEGSSRTRKRRRERRKGARAGELSSSRS